VNDAFVIICEPKNNGFHISTRELFNIYDEDKGVIFHSEKGDLYVPCKSYHFKSNIDLTFMFENIYEYDVAVFPFDIENQGISFLSEWEIKLLELFHIEWFNELRKFLNSVIFVNILTEVEHLRKMSNVLPPKSEVFKNFKHSIAFTDIPYSLTYSNGVDHASLWRPFIKIAQQIKLKHDLNTSSSYLS
jgi:hypothetical protein